MKASELIQHLEEGGEIEQGGAVYSKDDVFNKKLVLENVFCSPEDWEIKREPHKHSFFIYSGKLSPASKAHSIQELVGIGMVGWNMMELKSAGVDTKYKITVEEVQDDIDG